MSVLSHKIGRFAQNATRQVSQRLYSQKPAVSISLVDVEVDDKTGVAVVSMNRPPVNSLNTPLLQKLGATLKELESNKTRGLILTSKNDGVFSAGLDILEMYNTPTDQLTAFWTSLQSTWLSLYKSSFPTVAAINGHAPAGGCLLALSCEYRVMMGPKFTIGLNETQLGIIAPPWFIICMRDVIGSRQTELALTSGRMIPAPEALKLGMIDAMVSTKDEAMAEAQKFISQFAKIPPMARKLTKECVRQEGIKYMEENMIDDLKLFTDTVTDPKVQKGLELYLASLKKK